MIEVIIDRELLLICRLNKKLSYLDRNRMQPLKEDELFVVTLYLKVKKAKKSVQITSDS